MKFFLSLTIVAILLTGCEKSFENFASPAEPVNNDTVWAATNNTSLSINDLHNALMRPPVSDSFLLSSTNALLLPGNTRLEIPAAAFAQATTGYATLDFYQLKTKGDFIRFRKPTITDNGSLLTNGNMVYLNVTKNAQPLQLLSSKTLKLSLTDSFTAAIKGYYGNSATASSGFGNYSWEKDDSTAIQLLQTGYQAAIHRTQWLLFGSAADSGTARSRTVLSMSSGFTNANTSAFIVYKNSRSVMQFVPDAANRIWLAEKVPSGKNVLYITLSKKGNDYWLGLLDLITTVNQNIRIVPVKKSLSDINILLDNL